MKQPIFSGIYKITNELNKKVYIGSGVNIRNRWSVHRTKLNQGKHHSSKLQRAWNKYGKKNFTFAIIHLCKDIELIETEQHYIDFYDSYHHGYNEEPTARSPLGRKVKETTKEKIRLAQLKLCKDPKEIKRRSRRAKQQHKEKNFGHHTLTPEGRKRMSVSAKKIGSRPENIARLQEMARNTSKEEWYRRTRRKRKSPSSERRKQISEFVKSLWKNPEFRKNQIEKRKGKKCSLATRKKRRIIALQLWKNPEFREKMSRAAKKRFS